MYRLERMCSFELLRMYIELDVFVFCNRGQIGHDLYVFLLFYRRTRLNIMCCYDDRLKRMYSYYVAMRIY